MANVYKYYNNGFLSIRTIEGAHTIFYSVEGYYYNTKVVDIALYYGTNEKDENNHCNISITDGGYHSSPYTTKMIKRMLNDVLDDINVDFGVSWQNALFAKFYNTIIYASSQYFKKYRKTECVVLKDKDAGTKFHFNF